MNLPSPPPQVSPRAFLEETFIETNDIGDVCVVVIDARVITDHQVEAAKHRLLELAKAHTGRLAIALSSTDGSSMGLFAALLHVQHFCERAGGRMVLFDLPPALCEALDRFGVLNNFNVAASLDRALAAVRGHTVPAGNGSWLDRFRPKRRVA